MFIRFAYSFAAILQGPLRRLFLVCFDNFGCLAVFARLALFARLARPYSSVLLGFLLRPCFIFFRFA
jgi:hypothetical protein